MKDKHPREQTRHKLLRAAHRHGLPVRDFIEAAIERFGGIRPAARQLQVDPKALRRYANGKSTFVSRLVELADKRGLDVLPFVIEAVDKYGSAPDAARALEIDVRVIYRHLYRGGVPIRKALAPYKKARMLQMLRDGFRAVDIARLLEIAPGTAYYYASKLKRMNRTIRRLDAA
jgi:hypothetical protein